MRSVQVAGFEDWRGVARGFLTEGVPPPHVLWNGLAEPSLFDGETIVPRLPEKLNVPKEFLTLAERVACHADPERWGLLYTALWRLTHGEPHLMSLVTDSLVRRLDIMDQAVRRDAHKAKAFVRFRLCHDEQGDLFVAWHRPDHHILPLIAPFMSRRFSDMRWTILTPGQSVHWDGDALYYGEGTSQENAPPEDSLEDLWRGYYRATFNPARIKLKTMRREMPVRYWATLPEASIIPSMLAEAPERVQQMLRYAEGTTVSAADFVPETDDLAAVRRASKGCEGCELYQHATQTVFGEGPAKAQLVLVGEQPGDKEDIADKPFVGPAGKILDKAMGEAGIPRGEVYITNAVKHFKFVMKGERRMHQSPSVREIGACKPWLEKEVAIIKPTGVLCLGASAAKSVIHRGFTLKDGRGRWQQSNLAPGVMATYHPSAILRAPEEAMRERMMADLTHDLSQMWLFIASHRAA